MDICAGLRNAFANASTLDLSKFVLREEVDSEIALMKFQKRYEDFLYQCKCLDIPRSKPKRWGDVFMVLEEHAKKMAMIWCKQSDTFKFAKNHWQG